jgi:ApbE superfamily uncharacterized protein (UPF0280 family)
MIGRAPTTHKVSSFFTENGGDMVLERRRGVTVGVLHARASQIGCAESTTVGKRARISRAIRRPSAP